MPHAAPAWLLLLAGMALTLPAGGQTAPVGSDSTTAANKPGGATTSNGGNGTNGNGRRNGKNGNGAETPPPYQDVFIEDGRLEPDIWIGDTPERNADGWPRGLRIDGIYSDIDRNGRSETQYGVGIGAFLATPLYGAWTFDGVFGRTYDSWVATLWQRDMPFDGGWRATNGAGNLNSPNIDLARFQPRWFLPTSPMLGASSEWRAPTGAQLTAGAGEPGVFTGLYVPGFRRLNGYLSTAGAQWSFARNWTSGLQYMAARDVTSIFQLGDNPQEFSTRSWFGSTAWQDATRRFQVNALGTDNSFTGDHMGAWADGYIQDGRYGHGFGTFWLGSDLVWGNQPVGSDIRGAYYRINYASRQWLWDANVDYTDPIGNNSGDSTTFFSGSVRHQIWQGLGIGGGGNARFNGHTAWSAFTFVENTLPALINRTQFYVARNEPQREYALTASQTWNVPAGTRLATTLLLGRYEDDELRSTQFGIGIIGGGDIARDLSVDANVQWTKSTGEAQPTVLIGNLGLTWRFARDLQFITTLYRSQARSDLPLRISSPIDDIARPPEERINDRGVMLMVRYETRAGTMAAPLGGTIGSGAGRVTGYVYLDGNEDGRMAAGEPGAANVTVVLNGRWSVRTDGQGRFEFPSIAAGTHTIAVISDNLPLPWTLVNDGRVQFDVPVRGTVNVDIPAQRIR